MNKNVLQKRCFYLNLIVIVILAAHKLMIESLKFIKNREVVDNVNSHLKNINLYIDKCKKYSMPNNKIMPNSKPKITAIITVYNSEKFLRAAIKSVQFQKFFDIEILVVDDCSEDSSVYITRKLKKYDKRIKLIRNKVNRGVLYSKSLGILKSNGKYIMFLDSDDLFVNENIFSLCYKIAIKENIDIVEFSGFENNFTQFELSDIIPKIPLYLKYKKHNEVIRQPELSKYLYKKLDENKYKLIDGYLWGKCIKRKSLKDSLKIIGPNLYTTRLNYGDDRLINLVLFRVAKSFKFIKEFGYMYNQNNVSITHSNSTINNCRDELTNIFFIYNFTRDTNEADIAAFEIFKRFNKIIYPGLRNKANKKYLMKMIKLMLKDKYITDISKTRLLNLTNYVDV